MSLESIFKMLFYISKWIETLKFILFIQVKKKKNSTGSWGKISQTTTDSFLYSVDLNCSKIRKYMYDYFTFEKHSYGGFYEAYLHIELEILFVWYTVQSDFIKVHSETVLNKKHTTASKLQLFLDFPHLKYQIPKIPEE